MNQINSSKNKILLIMLLMLSSTLMANHLDSLTMPFIKNQGQVAQHVNYYAQTPKALIYLNKDNQINYKFNSKSDHSNVIRETLINGNTKVKGLGNSQSQISYFKSKGNNHENINNYNKLNLGKVWDGVEVEIVARPGNIEKIFKVAPGTNIDKIQIKVSGIKSLSKDDTGQLLLTTKTDIYAFTSPIAWQNLKSGKKMVEVAYNIEDMNYGFSVGEYDKSKELIIDPLLSSTYIGGGQLDTISGIRVDSNGDIIIAGSTGSLDFPVTTGAISESNAGATDLYVMRLNSEMCELISATYIGGSGNDTVTDVAFDQLGNVYLLGGSNSMDFPLPSFPYTPFQSDLDPNGSIHVTKISADLSEILGSTFIGGNIVDNGRAIEVSPVGNVYITGFTNSMDYPYTPGAFETSGQGAIISAFNSDLSQLLYSTRIGGGDNFDLVFENDNSVFVVGTKISTSDYSTTTGVYSETPLGGLEGDNYIAHMSEDLSTLISATFIGSNSIENPYDIELYGNEIIVATWVKNGFPLTSNPFDDTLLLGGSTAVFKMTKDLINLNASTYIDLASGTQFMVEDDGHIVLFGATSTTDFPGGNNPSDPLDENYNGGSSDFGLVRLNPELTVAVNSAYIGGSDQEIHANDLIKNNEGQIILSGTTRSTDIETTQFGLDRSYNGNVDVILQKIPSNFNQQEVIGDLIFCNSFEVPTGLCSCN